MQITPQKLAALRYYAAADAALKGMEFSVLDSQSAEDEAVSLARFMAMSEQYSADDWNLDNRKRNVAIRLFLEVSLADLRDYGRAWLERWRAKSGNAHWFREWEEVLNSGSDDLLTRILLSSEDEPTRQRLSMPFSGLLDADTVLSVKRQGVPI